MKTETKLQTVLFNFDELLIKFLCQKIPDKMFREEYLKMLDDIDSQFGGNEKEEIINHVRGRLKFLTER